MQPTQPSQPSAQPLAPADVATQLDQSLGELPGALLAELDRFGFDRKRLHSFAQAVANNAASGTNTDNRVAGLVEPPADGDVTPALASATQEGAHAIELGRHAIARGEVGFVVLAGGMATRMGGVVKALVEALPGISFLGYRLREVEQIQRKFGGRIPLWLMTSLATDLAIRQAIEALPASLGANVGQFAQSASLRLRPDGTLFRLSDGSPSIYATGHGDLPDAISRSSPLANSSVLSKFLAQGGKTLWIANIDNLGATIDPAILGFHLAHGAPVTVEVVEKVGSDKGGIPARLDNRPVILEEFRLPKKFDGARVRTFNTNTFLVDARALKSLELDWTYFEVRKSVVTDPTSGRVEQAVQFERLLGEITSALDTRFVKVPREGLSTRFLPVKDGPELDARRSEIEAIARDRGIL